MYSYAIAQKSDLHKPRLMRKWLTTKVEIHDQETKEVSRSKEDGEILEFREKGDYWMNGKEAGTWRLTKDKKHIEVYIFREQRKVRGTILELTKNKLTLMITDGQFVSTVYFKPL